MRCGAGPRGWRAPGRSRPGSGPPCGATAWAPPGTGSVRPRSAGRAQGPEPVTVRVPVLMYHGIADDPAPETRALSVRPGEFAAQLELLRDLGFTPVTFAHLVAGLQGGRDLPETPRGDHRRRRLRRLPPRSPPRARPSRHAGDPVRDDRVAARCRRVRGGTPSRRDDDLGPGDRGGRRRRGDRGSQPQPPPARPACIWAAAPGAQDLYPAAGGSPGPGGDELRLPVRLLEPRVRDEVRAAGYAAACAVSNAMATARHAPYVVPRLTVRRSTSLALFERFVRGQGLAVTFCKDHALVKGWAIVRRSRFAINRALARV